MKITFLINTLSEGKGIPNRVASMAVALDKKGDTVSIVTFDRANRSLPDSIRVLEPKLFGKMRLPYRFLEMKSGLFNALARTSIMACLKRLAPEVVVVDFVPVDRYAMGCRKKLGYKVVYTYHGIADPEMYTGEDRRKRIETRDAMHAQVRRADYVMAVSWHTARELESLGIQSVVVPNGVDMDFFRPGKKLPAIQKKGPVLMYIGRYTPHKGVMNLLQAFAVVKKEVPDAVLYMFARHEHREYVSQLKQFIADNGLSGSVMMFRDIYGEIVPYLYGGADIFVSGALDETFGMTFVEAAACGTPSAAFASKSIPEVVDDGKTGILCEPGDSAALARGIIKLLKDRKLLDEYSRNAVEFARKYNWDSIADQMRGILRGKA
ncbi:MAG: glycosyltransferase family 4 protein [Candidatus Auribacterota bacterium]